MSQLPDVNNTQFFHGTKAQLKRGDLLSPGFKSNYGKQNQAKYIYFTATMDAAIWGAELALGNTPGKIYIVKPTGPFENDPNLTDKKFKGNPTMSYRTAQPLMVIGEIEKWEGHTPDRLKEMHDNLARLKQQGIEAIED